MVVSIAVARTVDSWCHTMAVDKQTQRIKNPESVIVISSVTCDNN